MQPTPDRGRRIHPAWTVAAVTLLALVAGAAFRSSTGALLQPLEHDFGWSRTQTSLAVTLNLVIYGLVAPFAAALMERFGIRRVVVIALLAVGAGSALTTVMTAPWQLWLLWGVVIGGGTGAMALVLGAIVAGRWFERHRGLVMGCFGAANATGQLVFLPAIVALADGPGWRWAAWLIAALAVAVVPPVLTWFRDRPADLGVLPYGAVEAPPVAPRSDVGAARLALRVLREVARSRVFWILMATFWVCGWTTNGLVQSHFIPAAHDHGMPAHLAAWALAVIGIFDIIGTLASGWLTDRVDPRWLLVGFYAFRGVSLLLVDSLLGPEIAPPLWVFIVFYGLDWVATVPPTVALCRIHFGLERSGIVFGWVFASHMVGAGVAAYVAGALRQATGSYESTWLLAAALCGISAASLWLIPRRSEAPVAT